MHADVYMNLYIKYVVLTLKQPFEGVSQNENQPKLQRQSFENILYFQIAAVAKLK